VDNSLSILLKAKLDTTGSQGDINLKIKELEKKLEKLNIKLNIDNSEIQKTAASLTNIQKQIEQSVTSSGKIISSTNIKLTKDEVQQRKVAYTGLFDFIKRQETEITAKNKEIGLNSQTTKNIEIYAQKMQNAISRLQIGKDKVFASEEVQSELSKLQGMLESFSKGGAVSTKDLGLQFDNLRTKVAQASNEFKNVNKDGYSFTQMLELAAKKIAIWGISTSLVYGSFRQLKEGISYLSQLDNSLNEIRIVTNKTQSEVISLAKSYNTLAKEMYVTTKEITGTAADLYRQGLNDTQVEDRMKAIIQYAKISSISLNNSNSIITATANATGESVQKIIDVFALLGDSTASGADEIGEALQKVASAADNSNLSLEKSASWIATISSITRESASTIGRSLNSVISRYESIKKTGFNSEDATKLNDVVKALSDVGITALDSQGQLRDFADIMDEVGAKFNTLSKNEQAYLTTTMFGTYQRNRGITLLRNYNDSLKNYETALNAAGTAEQKFNIYQESTQAKLDKLTASWEGFWQNSLDSNLIKGTLDALIKLADTFGNLQSVLILAGTALAIWKGSALTSAILGMKSFSLSTKLASSSMLEFRTISSAMQLQSMGLLTTTQMLTTSFKALGSAILTSFATNPIGWIAIGLTAYTTITNSAKQKQEELNQSIKESADNAKTTTNSITELLGKYEQLNSLTIKDESSRQELKTVQEQIIKLLGMEKDAINLVNDARGESIKKVREESFEKLKANEDSLRASLNLAKENTKNALGSSSNILGSGYEYYDFKPSDLSKKSAKILQDAKIDNLSISDRWITTELEGANERIKVVQKAIDTLKNAGIKEGEVYNQLVKSRDNYQTMLDNENNALTELNKNLAAQGALQASITIGTPNKSNFEQFKKSAIEYIAQQQNVTSVSNDFRKVIYDQIDNMYPSLSGVINKTSKDTGNASQQLESYSQKLDEQNKAIDETQSSLKSLSELYYQVSEGQSLSSDQILDLIQQYPQIIQYMNSEGNLMISQQDLLKTLFELKKQDRIQTLQAEKDKADAVIASVQTQRDAYLGFYRAMGATLNLSENQAASMFGFDKASYDSAVKASADTQAKISALEKVTFKTYKPKTTSNSGRNRAELQQSESLIEKDRYYQLNQELNKTNNLLEKNAALQENATYEKKIKLLDEEIKLLKQKRINIHNIAEEERKERAELVASLKNQGVKFSGTGDNLSTTNAKSILDKSLDSVNAHGNDKDKTIYNNLKSQYDSLKSSLDRFFEIQLTDLPKAGKEWIQLSSNIDKINLDKISLSFDKFNDSLKPANNELEKLEHQYKMLGDSDYALKEKNLNEQLAVKNKMLITINKQINEYSKLMKAAKSDEIKKMYQDEIDSLTQQAYQLEEAAIERVNNLRIDAIEALKDAESKRHKKAMDDLDDELEKYQDNINSKIKALDELYAKEDYERNIANQDKDIQAKQNELNALSLDDSEQAQARKAQLQQELLELQSKKEDTQRDYAREQEKGLLNDLLDLKEKNINDQKKLEDAKYESFQTNIDKMLQGTTDFYNQQDNISKMSIDNVISYYENLNKTANGVYDNLISKLQQAKNLGMENPITPDSSLDSLMPSINENNIVGLADYLESRSHDVEWKDKSVYIDGKKIDKKDLNGSGIKLEADEHYYGKIADIKKLLAKYGITFDQGGLAYGKGFLFKDTIKPEEVLDPDNTVTFRNLVSQLPSIKEMLKSIDILKSYIPNISKFNPSNLVNNIGNNPVQITAHTTIIANESMDINQLVNKVETQVYTNIANRLITKGY
jgi:TP901 family phage tail tape measure protein